MIILHLTKASLKKKKGMAVTLVFLSALATLFLNLGLIMSSQMREACASAMNDLRGPDFFAAADGTKYDTSFEDFLLMDDRVQFVENEEVIYMESTNNNVNSSSAGAIIFNMDTDRKIEPVHLIQEDSSIPGEEAIYLPLIMKYEDIPLGSEYILTYKNVDHAYRVAGFFETTCLGTMGYSFMKYYMPAEAFQKLYDTAGTGRALSVRLQEGLEKYETSNALKKDFLEATDYYNKVGSILAGAACLSYEAIQDNMLSLISIPMMVMISVAFIICVINFITVSFKVKEAIDDSMAEIGSLQAMGYTTGQIMLSHVAEFAILGALGGTIGVFCSYAAMPAIVQYGEGMIGISLHYGIHIGLNLLSLLIIVVLLTAGAVLAAWNIRRIPPVTALRKGVRTDHFGRNLFPLHKGRSTVIVRLALKNVSSDFRRNGITVFAMAMGVFAISLSAVLYVNFGYDTSALTRMTGMEIADIQVTPLPHVDADALSKELEAFPEIRKTNLSRSHMASIGDEDVFWIITEDFSKTELLALTSGTFPQYDNEVVLSTLLMRKLGKEVGDTIPVTANGITREYLITGILTGLNNDGKEGLISLEGMRRLDPYYNLSQIDIYLKDGADRQEVMDKLYRMYGVASRNEEPAASESASSSDETGSDYSASRLRAEARIKKLLEQYGVTSVEYAVMLRGELILTGSSDAYKIKEINSLDEYLDGQLASYAATMIGMMTVVLLVMLLVMGAIISITVSSLIRRQKTDLGVLKALGYTTKDLCNIVRLNITLNALIGSLAGVIICRLFANKLLHLLFIQMGGDLSDFNINLPMLVLIGLLALLYVWFLSTWRAGRLKKITVYDLLSE